jgi:hypothetical protein
MRAYSCTVLEDESHMMCCSPLGDGGGIILPGKIRIIAINEVTQTLSNVFDKLDTFEGLSSALKTVFSLRRIRCNRRAESMYGSKCGEVLELKALPVYEYVHPSFQ